MCTSDSCLAFAPRKFLCCLPLKIGAVIAGLIMCMIMVPSVLVTTMRLGYISGEMSRTTTLQKFVFAYNVIAVLYAFLLLLLCLWFLVAIFLKQASVILAWLVMSSIWILLLFCVWLHISLELYYFNNDDETNLWLIVRLVVGIIVYGIMVYFQMVVLGYWFELKRKDAESSQEA